MLTQIRRNFIHFPVLFPIATILAQTVSSRTPSNIFYLCSIFATLNRDVKTSTHHADVVELVDTLALGASAARREGSSPFIRTNMIMVIILT